MAFLEGLGGALATRDLANPETQRMACRVVERFWPPDDALVYMQKSLPDLVPSSPKSRKAARKDRETYRRIKGKLAGPVPWALYSLSNHPEHGEHVCDVAPVLCGVKSLRQRARETGRTLWEMRKLCDKWRLAAEGARMIARALSPGETADDD